MFESLGEKFDSLLRKLQGQGRITERNIEEALHDVRLALLEADVNLDVVRDFVEAVKRDALGEEVLRSLTPEQHFIKLVHRELVRALGGAPATLDLGGAPPVVVMLVGLNGSGKTTTTAKLARHLREERGRSPYLASVDVYRPAAMAQLETLARQLGVPVHPAGDDDPSARARDAVAAARAAGTDTVLLDTAGRQTVDEELMRELERLVAAVRPGQVLLVADAMTGQDAVATAQGFAGRLPVSGVIVKKMGSVANLIGMIPGVKKLLKGADLTGAEDELKRVEAIIDSMTRQERRNVHILNSNRRKRIASGSGTSVAEVNRLIKQFTQT